MSLFQWTAKSCRRLELGQSRVVSKFLLLPKELDGEYRWLGTERIVQYTARKWSHAPEGIGSFMYTGWVDRHWAGAGVGDLA